jgi:NAD(P)H-quinone oxidoreductase subunit 5
MHDLAPLLALLGPVALLGASLRPRAVVPGSVVGVLVAPFLFVALAAVGATQTPLLGVADLGLALRLDALSATLFTMVALLGAILLRFSGTYLEGDPRRDAFLGRFAATLASVEVLVLSGNLVLFVLAWVATSLTLHRLLVFRSERQAARVAARKKFLVARLGDLALLTAAGLIYGTLGTGDLGAILELAPAAEGAASQSLALAALAIAIAAALKSAQFPTHGWLIEVIETPTPVSALLHAGLLNAGPFLVVRFAGVMEHGFAAAAFLVIVGGFTALFASTVLLTQPSVKVSLGYSSAAHMGFMLLVCGLGVYPAAILHLVAHSFYKAHAFLTSGSAIEQAVAARIAGASKTRPLHRLAGLALAAVMYLGLAAAFGVTPMEEPALLAVGAILVLGIGHLLGTGLAQASTVGVALRAAGLALAVTLSFFTLEGGTGWLLEAALPAPTEPALSTLVLSAGVLTAFAAAIAVQALGFGTSRAARAAHVHLRNGLYANAYFDRLVGAYRL